MKIRRFSENPLIVPNMDGRIGTNINGPSLIRTPEWIENPLGRYYLYFAHHQGEYIRLAYADKLEGPWQIYSPGTLQLSQTPCSKHIASPDVHVDKPNRRIILYYHGPYLPHEPLAVDLLAQKHPIAKVQSQRSFVATSDDGLHFETSDDVLGSSYFRVFTWQDQYYALGMPGIFYRSSNGLTNFEVGPKLFSEHMRHCALRVVGSTLQVFYSNAGDCPERILLSEIDLAPNWDDWKASEPIAVIEPATDYEGGHLAMEASRRGSIHEPVRQLRDPCIFEEAGRTYLLYSVAGESGIGGAEITF